MSSDLPDDFSEALTAAGLADFFSACTPAHRREYLAWITGAKRPEARQARIGKAIGMIRANRAEETERTARKLSRARP